MSKTYLHVGSEWSLLFEPQDSDKFLVNITNTPVLFQFYSEEVTDISIIDGDRPFALGGTIGQSCIPAGKYCYAKAVHRILSDGTYINDEVFDDNGDMIDPESTLAMADESIAVSRYDVLSEMLASTINSVMDLSVRVTKSNLKNIWHHLDYIKLLRRFLKHAQKTHYSIAHLQDQILSIRMKMIAMESSFNTKIEELAESTNAEITEIKENLATLLMNAKKTHIRLAHLQDQILIIRMKMIAAEKDLKERLEAIVSRIDDLEETVGDSSESLSSRLDNLEEIVGDNYDSLSSRLDDLETTVENNAEATAAELAEINENMDILVQHANNTHYSLAHLQDQILSMRMKAIGAENDLKAQFSTFSTKIDGITSDIEAQFSTISAKIDEITQEISTGTETDISELRRRLDSLNDLFTLLNTALVQLSACSSTEEIDSTYATLTNGITDTETLSVLAAIRNAFVTLIESITYIRV